MDSISSLNTKPLRVALGSVFPYAETSVKGGVEAVAYYLTRALEKMDDIDLHIVSCSPAVSRDCVERRGNAVIHWLKSNDRMHNVKVLTSDAWRVAQTYRAICPDVIHAQGFTEYAVAAHSSQKMLLSIHGLEAVLPRPIQMRHFQGAAGFYRRLTGKMIARLSIRRAQGIVANAGEYTLKFFPRLFAGKKIFFIANPVSPEFFAVQRVPASSRRTFNLLWVGVMTERKNLTTLTRCFASIAKEYPFARLILAGHIEEQWHYETLKRLFAELNIEKQVTVTGAVSQSEILNLYANADLFVFPSIEETAPMAVAQAMAVGLPVIASRVGGIPWMLDEGKAGTLEEPLNEAGWVDGVVKLIRQEEARTELERSARQRALRLFSAQSIAGQTLAAYRELLGESANQASDI